MARAERAFAAEAREYGQRESEYARFILNARKEPMLFLQLCRLRDSTFAAGLMGNPTEAGFTNTPPRNPYVVSWAVKWEQGPLYAAFSQEAHFDLFGGSNNVHIPQL